MLKKDKYYTAIESAKKLLDEGASVEKVAQVVENEYKLSAEQLLILLEKIGVSLDGAQKVIASQFPGIHIDQWVTPHVDTRIPAHGDSKMHIDTPSGPHVDTKPIPHGDVKPHIDTPAGPHVDTKVPPHGDKGSGWLHWDTPSGPHSDIQNPPHSDVNHHADTPSGPHVDTQVPPHGDSKKHVDSPAGPHVDNGVHIDINTDKK